MTRSARDLEERKLRAEVCVIGSGGGGAVAAAVLAEAGRDVVLLEQGGHLSASDFDGREETMLPRLYDDAGMRFTDDAGVTILQAHGVGGSSVPGLCTCFRAPEPVLELWRSEHGLGDLELGASFERVEKALHVTPVAEADLNPLNRAVKRGSELLGYHGVAMRQNRVGCVGSGYCLLGCSYDAKQTMAVTYVPRAVTAGARVLSHCRVDRIERAKGGRRVRAHVVDAGWRNVGDVEIEARIVVCAAGALGTPVVLKASGLGNDHVGRHLHLNPSLFASGVFPEPMRAHAGIPQGWYVDEFLNLERDPRTGYALAAIAGFPILTAANLPGFGPELFEWLREYPKMGGLMATLHDRSSGRVERGEGGRAAIEYALEPEDAKQLTRGLKRVVEVLWAGGAERVLVPYLLGGLSLVPEDGTAEIDRRGVHIGEIPLISMQPQGSCRMGANDADSATDPDGALRDAPNVFVCDASSFPTSLGAPPHLTTAALADRTAHHIAANWAGLKA